MDRFEEFKEDIVGKLNTYKCNRIYTSTALLHTSKNDTERVKELSEKLVEYQHHVWFTDRQYNNFLNEKDKIAEMLNGFYNDVYCWRSFIYHDIYAYHYNFGDCMAYKVEDKTFPTLEEAMEYSKSLGVREDWKNKVYMYL